MSDLSEDAVVELRYAAGRGYAYPYQGDRNAIRVELEAAGLIEHDPSTAGRYVMWRITEAGENEAYRRGLRVDHRRSER